LCFSQTLTEPDGQVRELLVGARALVGPEVKPTHGNPIGWDGHLIVVLPKEGLLIDNTMWQMRRSWCDWIPNTAIVRLVAGPI
jgi:hypothetical protein